MPTRRSLVVGSTAAIILNAGVSYANSLRQTGGGNMPTIFATGGAFPGIPGNWAFGKRLLSLSAKPEPLVCFLGAASGDSEKEYEDFKETLSAFPCKITTFEIFRPSTLDFIDYLMGVDIVFVGSGSTRNLMALWRDWGFDRAIISAWKSGVVMSGSSAGALCWYDAGLSDSYPKVLSPVRGLGILHGSADVHHHSRPDRAPRFRELISGGTIPSPGLALDEEVAALYRGTTLVELFSVKPGAGAWLLTKSGDGVAEQRLPVTLLAS